MSGDGELIQIVDAALAEATRKSGAWLACHPGCFECCIGPFAINQLDAQRLRAGLAELEISDPARAARVRQRVREAIESTPALATAPPVGDAEFEAWIEQLPEEELCPALDPETGTCDLYTARPVTCRLFGPPIRWGQDAVGICELCFVGATDQEIAACEVHADVAALEMDRLREDGGERQTVVALALR